MTIMIVDDHTEMRQLLRSMFEILRRNRRTESAAATGHSARDGDCEKIRAGNRASAWRVTSSGAPGTVAHEFFAADATKDWPCICTETNRILITLKAV